MIVCICRVLKQVLHRGAGPDQLFEAALGPQELREFEEQLVNMGTWTAVSPVHSIEVGAF